MIHKLCGSWLGWVVVCRMLDGGVSKTPPPFLPFFLPAQRGGQSVRHHSHTLLNLDILLLLLLLLFLFFIFYYDQV